MAKNKMTTCDHCGQEIASSAKTCPNCGAKIKKPIYKRVWFWIVVVVLVFGIGGSLGGKSDTSTADTTTDTTVEDTTADATEEAATEYQEVSVETLFDELENNAMNASDTYKGQNLAVSGVLGTIDSDGSYIALESSNDNYMFQSVTCYIKSDEQLETIKSLSKGDSITVKGKVTDVGEVLGYYMNIDEIVAD